MRKENFYRGIIILLLLLNIGILAFLWQKGDSNVTHAPEDRAERPEAIIINELKLDDTQQEQFRLFKHRHRHATDSVQRQIRELQRALFGLVEQDVMDTVRRDSLLKQIESCEAAKHLITIEHFHDIRSILHPGQKALFNEFMEDMGSRITAPGRPHRRPPPHRR